MTIGIFTDTYDTNANPVSLSAKMLYDALTSHGHTVYIITSGSKDKVIQEDHVIKVPDLPVKIVSNLRMFFFYSSIVRKIIRKLGLDLIHIEEGYSIAYLGKLCGEKLNLPMIYTMHQDFEELSHSIAGEIKAKTIRIGIENTTHQIISDNGEIITHDLSMKKLLKEISPSTYVNFFPEPSENADSTEHADQEEYYQNTIYVYEKAIRKNY